MRHATVIILGAGQAGLAMSHYLTQLSIDHVLLERGQVAHTWRTERWDSLRLLTPNWQSRLPGFTYEGDDPDGFRTMPETIDFLSNYADHISAPVKTETEVTRVYQLDDGYGVSTTQGEWRCRAFVIASGACNTPCVPRVAETLPAGVRSMTPFDYHNPDELDDGGVLVVGASATGVQLAKEIQLSGRQVTLAVGEHVRVPRTYRGRDIKWWMDVAGVLDMGLDEIDDINRARNVPSLQLVGSPTHETISLNSLQSIGVQISGRVMGLMGDRVQFSGSLTNMCSMADLKMNRLLDEIDDWASTNYVAATLEAPYRLRPTQVPEEPMLSLDLGADGIKTVIWATGFRPDYSWLDVPVLDRKGRLQHQGGVVDAPGLYVLGLPFLRRRKSSLIDGVGDDARDLSHTPCLALSECRCESSVMRLEGANKMANSQTIKEKLERAAATVSARPTYGQRVYRNTATVEDGLTCRVTEKDHSITVDVPKGMGGEDEGPSPSMFIRGALTSCVAIGVKMWAARLGVEVDRVDVSVETDVDARGQLGVCDSTAPRL